MLPFEISLTHRKVQITMIAPVSYYAFQIQYYASISIETIKMLLVVNCESLI